MVVVKIMAGLGNQMFQYAFARAIGEKSGQEVVISSEVLKEHDIVKTGEQRNYSLGAYRITLRNVRTSSSRYWRFLSQETLLDKWKFHLSKDGIYPIQVIDDMEHPYGYQEKYLYPKRDTCYVGVYQNSYYFRDIRPILLQEFTLKKELSISHELQQLLQGRNTVSIHIRRGDYVKLHWNITGGNYYKNAVTYIEQYVADPVYLIFSDDLEWVKRNIKILGKIIYIDEQYGLKDYEELALMSCCRHNIIANSSFSWWGAWLNQNPDKIVIAPMRWQLAELEEGFIPEGWIRM